MIQCRAPVAVHTRQDAYLETAPRKGAQPALSHMAGLSHPRTPQRCKCRDNQGPAPAPHTSFTSAKPIGANKTLAVAVAAPSPSVMVDIALSEHEDVAAFEEALGETVGQQLFARVRRQ